MLWKILLLNLTWFVCENHVSFIFFFVFSKNDFFFIIILLLLMYYAFSVYPHPHPSFYFFCIILCKIILKFLFENFLNLLFGAADKVCVELVYVLLYFQVVLF